MHITGSYNLQIHISMHIIITIKYAHLNVLLTMIISKGAFLMSCLAKNLQALIFLSKNEHPRQRYSEYVDLIASCCGMTPEHFRSILRDKTIPTNNEVSTLCDYFNEYSDNLAAIEYVYLFPELMSLSKEEILEKNLQYLFGTLEHGENAEFVEVIGVNPSTLTRWKQGKTKPDKYAQNQIARYFGLRDAEDLKQQLLFLGIEPVSTKQKKQHCKKMIDEMEKDEFEAVYRALEKMLI